MTILLGSLPCSAQPPKGESKDEAALFKIAQAFVEAFHKGDAKALAAFWTADGDYIDQTGRRLKGRDAIEKSFTGFFAENKGLKLRINVEGVRFLTPDIAIEDGVTETIPPNGAPPSRARYSIVHIKKDGQWKVGSVREAAFAAPTNYDNLRVLEWAIGDWADESSKGDVARVSFAWSENQGFIISNYTTTFKNIAIGGGTQWIGWDPVTKQLRSWTFDTSGNFGEGKWVKEGDNKWVINSSMTLQSGKKVVATNILTRIDPDTVSWRSTGRSVDGEVFPDTKEIRMKRIK
jgi:uncharacterized protein (TIGR02246 family)